MIKYHGRQYRTATDEEAQQAEEQQPEYQDIGFGEAGRWGNEGSGILYTTGERVLLLHRAPDVLEPSCWGLPGGAVPENAQGEPLDLLKSAENEAEQEMGWALPGELIDTYVHEEPGFRYTTFICLVDEAATQENLQLNWESDNYGWFAAKDLHGLDLHPGVEELLGNLDPFYEAGQHDQQLDPLDTDEQIQEAGESVEIYRPEQHGQPGGLQLPEQLKK
ncbi:hypothetical protein LCGC14_0575610 [marine sediment metagenome]|uniref:Nudix hydrolase domain-containing protein n=1 Tax=marine sediment metagenome TaxID=412755 RepID=A0A0F9UR57_9ZZZZ